MNNVRKVVSTEMSDSCVSVFVSSYPLEGGSPIETCSFCFPMSLVNPRIALQIATLLVSDPTIPQSDEGEKK